MIDVMLVGSIVILRYKDIFFARKFKKIFKTSSYFSSYIGTLGELQLL